ncbi:MAG: CHAT domain-containing protein [Planctomycetota bacterium]
MPVAEPKLTLQVLWQSADAIRVTPFKEGSVLESTVKPSRVCPFNSALVADRAREVLSLLAQANASEPGRRSEDLLARLVAAGQAIYLDLLPAFLKERLEEAAGRNLLLHLDRQLLGIPWELLHDGDEFLGRRYRIGRLVSVEQEHERSRPLQRSMAAPLSVLIVADPAGDLPAARREAEELSQLLEDAALFGRITVLCGDVSLRTFRDELSRHDVLHYAGHADGGEAQGGRLRLRDGSFPASLLDQLRGRVDFPGFVFLNACASSDDTARLAGQTTAGRGTSGGGAPGASPASGVSSFASALLLGGVRHVIGTLWEVRDEVARLCAASFYRELSRGATIGASLAAAREALIAAHGEGSLFWADHVLYGDPTWRAVQPANAEFEDFGVLDGLERKYRQDLLSGDPATRLTAAAMLLRLGDRSVVPALGRDMAMLLTWLGPAASTLDQRRAALVVQSIAAAAGLEPSGPPDQLPDPQAVKALYQRLSGAAESDRR